MMTEFIIHSDGGSRGNPGSAAIGVHAEFNGKRVIEISKRIGITTNNVAEYSAVLEGMKEIFSLYSSGNLQGVQKISWYLDSQLVVEQLMGRFAIKTPHIKILVQDINKLRMLLPLKILFIHVPREENKNADLLVNNALDLML